MLLTHRADSPQDVDMTDETLIARSEERAARLLGAASPSHAEAARAKRLSRLLADDAGRDLLLELTDQVMRFRSPRRSCERLRDLTAEGVPASLGGFDRFGLGALGRVATIAPSATLLAVNWRVDKDTSGVILPADDPAFSRYLARRAAEGFRLNVNVLGEAILGDDEAEERCRRVIAMIERPDVDYVSVKISAICANLDVLAWDDSLARVESQLERVYRAARDAQPRTFVNLDMEEYRDLELSVEAFIRLLGRDEFRDLPAGIVLQAYIPDSHAALERLCAWANERHASGGAGIKIRLVKGANLANELVEAELHDWELATYDSKADVDASFKRMLDRALELGKPGAVRLGIASHNLFEVAWALAVRDQQDAVDRLEIEMLEGMAPPQARAVRDEVGSLLLYAPVVARADREASIAYLSRRLDENAAPDNFLRALFDITPGSPAWHDQAARFRASVERRRTVPTASRRAQVRGRGTLAHPADGAFANSADTDFTVAANRAWISDAVECTPVPAPVVLDSTDQVDDIVARALAAQREWAATPWSRRREVLAAVADVMERHRGETIAVMARTTGKTVREGDPEVSEAVDFATYAGHLTLAHEQHERAGAQWQPHGVVVVAGPWNFPYAIPASGLVHAVAAGSAAILKPAPQARAVGALLVDHLVEAGLPSGLVQLAVTPDDHVGQRLITHPDVDLVMLTGSFETAQLFTEWTPSMGLLAETSGKNALVITAAADIDQAIKDLVRSAFGHAGQKCSAASLAIVEASVYDDPSFHRRLADAVRSLRVGSPLDPATIVGPVIEEPSERLLRALTVLGDGETWLVQPRRVDAGESDVDVDADGAALQSWTPGVRAGVRAGSWFHRTECFGPVLGLMRAPDLATAVAWQNDVAYGLTGGIASLDPSEIDFWLERVQVGNAYVNRHITGAIVRRQPFGGWKRSSIGAGTKPGGPGHLNSYGTWTSPAASSATPAAWDHTWADTFAVDHDPSGLACEANILRYRPLSRVVVRAATADDPALAVLREAARVSGVPVQVSLADTEDEAALVARLVAGSDEAVRLRALVDVSDEVHRAAFASGVAVDRAPAIAVPRLELQHWVLEQSVSRTMHRYGRLLAR